MTRQRQMAWTNQKRAHDPCQTSVFRLFRREWRPADGLVGAHYLRRFRVTTAATMMTRKTAMQISTIVFMALPRAFRACATECQREDQVLLRERADDLGPVTRHGSGERSLAHR